jgi:hypothetical protein
MSTFLRYKGKKNAVIYNTGDWHVGSIAFNEAAALKLINMIIEDDAYVTFGGDAIEGKPARSNHFDPHSLKKDMLTIDRQIDYFCDLIRPIKNNFLLIQMGNHELYLLPDMNVTVNICENLDIDVYGDYQSWVEFGEVTMHFWHGRPVMPRGAKDPIQREANQKAWLKNKLYPLSGSAQAQYMAHTHHCLIVPPIEQYALLNHGDDVHGEYFIEQVREINGNVWVPPDARWYVNTGTLRRGGGFKHMDYSEISGYSPPAISCTRTEIKNNRIYNIKKVML